ncbi:nuclease-related domain-containing protein [Sporosarcina sp. ITBMC105]
MLYKNRTMPNDLQGLIALDKRLPNHHDKKHAVQKELYNCEVGYKGELEFDKAMLDFEPDYPCALLHDLYLHTNGNYFQIDSLLITPSAITIIEVKNFANKTVITENPTQFIKVYRNGDRKVLKNPIEEVRRKTKYLKNWLTRHNIQIPIESLIIFTHTNELAFENSQLPVKILFTYEAVDYLAAQPITEHILDKTAIQQLAMKFKNQHKTYNPFPLLKIYSINPQDISTGVICPACNKIGMRWEKRKWNCKKCGHTSKSEHEQTIKEWFMLINPQITNRQLRYFLQLPSRHVAQTLLAKSNLQLRGEKRAAHYILRKEGKAPIPVE